nr:RES family NAD+ phosphorylase [Altericroceibacterium endophyticum]
MPALYLALSFSTAIREVNQAGSLQPNTVVAYDDEIENVFDTRDPAALDGFKMDLAGLADPTWRDQVKAPGLAATQQLAIDLIDAGHTGMLVQSLAPGAAADDLNLVLWTWGETINGLYKAEVIHRCGPWRSFEAVEYATLEWGDWFNHRRLLEPKINIMLPRITSLWQRDSQPNASGRPRAIQLD